MSLPSLLLAHDLLKPRRVAFAEPRVAHRLENLCADAPLVTGLQRLIQGLAELAHGARLLEEHGVDRRLDVVSGAARRLLLWVGWSLRARVGGRLPVNTLWRFGRRRLRAYKARLL